MSKIRKCAVAEDAVRLLFESRLVARRVAKAIESIPDIDVSVFFVIESY